MARAAELPPDAAAAACLAVVRDAGAGGADAIKAKEDAVAKLGALSSRRAGGAIRALLAELRPFAATVPKAKTAKIMRMLLDVVAQIPGTVALQVALC